MGEVRVCKAGVVPEEGPWLCPHPDTRWASEDRMIEVSSIKNPRARDQKTTTTKQRAGPQRWQRPCPSGIDVRIDSGA